MIIHKKCNIRREELPQRRTFTAACTSGSSLLFFCTRHQATEKSPHILSMRFLSHYLSAERARGAAAASHADGARLLELPDSGPLLVNRSLGRGNLSLCRRSLCRGRSGGGSGRRGRLSRRRVLGREPRLRSATAS